MKRKIFLILTCALIVLTGCSDGASTDFNKPEKNNEFIFVCPMPDNDYWKQCVKGIQKADAELGTNTKVIGPGIAEGFDEKLADYMEEAIKEQPDGILAYAGIESMFPLIDRASGKGIPVITLDSDAPDTSRIAYVGTDAYTSGYEAGENMVSLTNGTAKVGMLVSSLSAEKETQVRDAFLDAVQDYDIELAAAYETHSDLKTAEAKTREMLEEHPEINAVFSIGAYNVTGTGHVKKELGRDDLILSGFDGTEENLQLVREGIINTLFVQRIEQAGYQAVYLMNEYLDKGSLSSEIYNTGTIPVDISNADIYSESETEAREKDKIVKVGYYKGDASFQNGFADDARKSGYAYDYYQAIASVTGWKYEYIYGSRREIMDMLETGEVDITAGIYQTDSLKKRILFSDMDIGMDGEKRYFAVSPQKTELLEELNKAMQQLFLYTPDFQATLKQKYYVQASRTMLSESERNWLSGKGTIRMGYIRHNIPFSGTDENNCQTGMIKNLTDYLRSFLKINIESVCFDDIIEMESALISGSIDAAFPIYSDLWLSENKNFHQTDAFIRDRVMIVYNGEYTDDIMDKVALSRTGIGQRYYIDAYYPDSEVTFYDSREEIFEAILDGRERCIIGCSSVIQRFLSEHPEYKNLNIAYLDTSEDFGMAVSEKSFILTEILNKAIKQIDTADITSWIMQYSSFEKPVTVKDFIRENSIIVFTVLSTILAVLILTFISYRRKTRRFNKEQTKTRAELEVALKNAQVANEAKTNFLSSMSHDIRTPMNAIVGMTSIASNHLNDTERVKECLNKISLSSHYLMTLINDVLDISKIESGKLILNPIVFSIKNTMTELVNIVQPQIKSKNLEFNVHIKNIKYENLYADEVRVNQIFVNLLTNAVKYTPEGGSISVSLSQEELPSGNHIRLIYTVEDTGIGMSAKFMENMYSTFSRAKDSRINKIQGTGLGLAIVKQMVDIIGGTIECRSAENIGTKFTVTLDLPFRENPDENSSLPGIRILIIDDDDIFLESAIELFTDMDAVPETSDTGISALEMIKSSKAQGKDYSVIIVDWKMRDMDGLETIKAINEITDKSIPIILISAYDWAEIEDEAQKCGADCFITKPLFRSLAYEKINMLLNINDDYDNAQNTADDDIRGRHVLVAEDNTINWEVLSEILSMYDITADWAQNGKICVDMLSSAPPGTYDMILMDIQMPVMNGHEAAKNIRNDDREYIRNIPIIAITADAFAEDISASIESGMNGHVSKPIDIDSLCQEMHKILNNKNHNQ